MIDNGSSDDSVAMVRDRFPEVRIISLPENIGFGSAINLAIRETDGDPLLLLNNDVRCEPSFIEEMIAALDPKTDMVAGVLTQDSAPDLIDSAGIIADRRTLMAFDYLRGHRVEELPGAPPPLAPTGGGALYRRAAFEAVGGFDERIFAYYEDLDLALRLKNIGAVCSLAPRARARHLSSATLSDHIEEKYALTGWSRGYMARRYRTMRSPGIALRIVAAEGTICIGQLILHGTMRGALGRLRGWRDAGGLPPRPIPTSGLSEISMRTGLTRRTRQYFAAPWRQQRRKHSER